MKLIKNGTTVTEVSQTFADRLLVAATAPLGVMSADATEFHDKKTMGITAVGWMIGGAYVGHKFGASIPGLNMIARG